MFVLVSYDIRTLDRAGQRRLRRVAKACESFGQRVQFSVFECKVTPSLWAELKGKLLSIYKPDEDSLRFYLLSEDDARKAEHHGIKASIDFEAPLIL